MPLTFSITRWPAGSQVQSPAPSWRTKPARTISLCEIASASAGSSRSVGMKYPESRVKAPLSLSATQSLAAGTVARTVEDLELEAVRVVEEDRVIALGVLVLLWARLDLGAAGAQPLGALVDDIARICPEREVVDAEVVAVVRLHRARLALAQADRPHSALAADVEDALATLTLDLRQARIAERAQQL